MRIKMCRLIATAFAMIVILLFQGCAQDTPPESGPITGGHSNSAPSPGTTETSSIFRACSTVKSRSRRRSSARRASSKVSRSPTVSPSTRIAYFDRRSGMIRIRIVAFIPELLHWIAFIGYTTFGLPKTNWKALDGYILSGVANPKQIA